MLQAYLSLLLAFGFSNQDSQLLLGYYLNGDPADGEYRPIQIRVSRPGVPVRSKKGSIASRTRPGVASGSRRTRSYTVQREPETASLYTKLIDAYRSGNPEDARRILATWSEGAVRRAVNQLRSRPRDPEILKAAIVLHTEVVVHHARDLTADARTFHVQTAESLLGLIPDERLFGYKWLLTIAYYYQGTDLSKSMDYSMKAIEIYPDDASILLAIGSTEEAYVWRDDDKGKLKDAEKFYRKALQADPDLAEAHLRLGRVLQQRGAKFEEETLRELSWVVEHSRDTYLVYLANVFLGDLHKAKERFAEAIASYRAAVRAEPRWQVAYLSLSQALRAAGDRLEARDVAREALMLPVFDPDYMDGYRLYSLGQFSRVPGMLERMREEVGQ